MAEGAIELSLHFEEGRVWTMARGQRYEAGSLPALKKALSEDLDMPMMFLPADEAARSLVDRVRELQRKAQLADEQMRAARGPIFFKLWADHGMSVRDIAMVCGGVSHGTVSNIILEEKSRVAETEGDDGR